MCRLFLLATAALSLSATVDAHARASVEQRPPADLPATTPQASPTQQGVLVFTAEFFAEQQPSTALDMVSRIPGFTPVDGDGSRGFEGAVGNILINGSRPASKNDTGSSILSRTLTRQVERIELIRGGAPGIDMQGFPEVVNVVLRSEDTRESLLTLSYDLFNGGRDLFGGSYQFTSRSGGRTWGILLSDGISRSDGNGVGRVRRLDAAGVVLRDEALRTEGNGGGSGIRGNFSSPFWGGKVDLTARVGTNDWHGATIQSGPDVLRNSANTNDSLSGELGVSFTRPLAERLSVEARFIHTTSDFASTSISGGFVGPVVSDHQQFEASGLSSETILRSLVRWERSPASTLEGGGEIAYNLLHTDQSFTVNGTVVLLPSASVKVEETRSEIFGRGTWRPSPNLTLEGGLRLEASTISQSGDASQEKSFFFAKPRFQATWTPAPGHQFRLRTEREVGQLDFGDFAASSDLAVGTLFGGNVDLEPESRWIREITYERRFWGEGILSVGYRYDSVSNYIDVIPLAGGLSASGNIGDGNFEQISLNLTLPADRLGFIGGRFTFQNNWINTEVTDPTSGERRGASHQQESQPVIGVFQNITSWDVQWGAILVTRIGENTYNPDFTNRFRARSDYFQAHLEYKPTPTLSVRFQLTDADDFVLTRTAFVGRSTRTVAFTETRMINPRTFWSLQVRKSF